MNGTLTGILSRFIKQNEESWDLLLNGALLAYRSAPHVITKETPFRLIYGRRCRLPGDISLLKPSDVKGPESEVLSNIAENILLAQNLAKEKKRYKFFNFRF